MGLSREEIVEKIAKLRKETWKFLKEAKLDYCFDCGKTLTEKDGIVVYDPKGIMTYCLDHTWAKIYVKDFWDKVFRP